MRFFRNVEFAGVRCRRTMNQRLSHLFLKLSRSFPSVPSDESPHCSNFRSPLCGEGVHTGASLRTIKTNRRKGNMKLNRRQFLSRWSSLAVCIPFVPGLMAQNKSATKASDTHNHQSSHPMGAGRCSKCSCVQYTQDYSSDNGYCTCGHSYGDHW